MSVVAAALATDGSGVNKFILADRADKTGAGPGLAGAPRDG